MSEAGDRLSVEQGGDSYASGPFSEVRLENLDPATDRVVGVVVPRRGKVRITGTDNGRLTPTGYRAAPAFVKVAATDAAGAFDVDLTSEGNPIRNDAVFVGAVQGTFEIGVYASFPGLDIQKDSNYGLLTGIPGTTHLVRLYGPGGGIKGESEVTLGTGGFLSAPAAQQHVSKAAIGRGSAGIFFFEDAAGRPVRILEGDVIAVGGAAAFAFKVPKLAPGMGGSRFAVRTLPNRPVYLLGQDRHRPELLKLLRGLRKDRRRRPLPVRHHADGDHPVQLLPLHDHGRRQLRLDLPDPGAVATSLRWGARNAPPLAFPLTCWEGESRTETRPETPSLPLCQRGKSLTFPRCQRGRSFASPLI